MCRGEGRRLAYKNRPSFRDGTGQSEAACGRAANDQIGCARSRSQCPLKSIMYARSSTPISSVALPCQQKRGLFAVFPILADPVDVKRGDNSVSAIHPAG